MNKIVSQIKKDFNQISDLKVKSYKGNLFSNIYIIYLQSICSSNKINDYVLKNLSLLTSFNKNLDNLGNALAGPNTVLNITQKDIEFYLTNGFTLVIFKNKIYAIETKGELSRNIDTANIEQTIKGPQDGFTENIEANIGQIKRRIKSRNLKNIDLYIGRSTKTKISINYMDNIADLKNLNYILTKLEKIDVDGILDSSIIAHYIDGENKSMFPTIKQTERPDIVVKALLDGKIIIVVDTSPFILILPAYFIDFINPISDNYTKSINVKFLKFLRLVCFGLSMLTPAIYLSLINYNQETIPTTLLINFATQRINLPFPTIFEALIMLLICEILRESDIRFPSSFGSSISVLGALILGEAAVSAGIVSPIMIIIISLTFISSLLFTELEISNALRNYRFLFLLFAAVLGLYGVFLCTIIFLTNILSIKTINKPYFAPIMPFDKTYFDETVNKMPNKEQQKRSILTTDKNFTRSKTL